MPAPFLLHPPSISPSAPPLPRPPIPILCPSFSFLPLWCSSKPPSGTASRCSHAPSLPHATLRAVLRDRANRPTASGLDAAIHSMEAKRCAAAAAGGSRGAAAHSLSLHHTLSHSITLSLTPSHSLTLHHTLSHSITLSLTPSHSLSLNHTLSLHHTRSSMSPIRWARAAGRASLVAVAAAFLAVAACLLFARLGAPTPAGMSIEHPRGYIQTPDG